MSKESSNEYMLIFRGTDWYNGLSAEEMQQVASQWMAWFNRLKDENKVVTGSPLEPTGKIVSGKGGRVVADGPFPESKEAIGGFFMLSVDDLDEAVAIAQECPGLAYGIKVEVRQVAETCRMLKSESPEHELAHSAA
jgi:hypothetical protein